MVSTSLRECARGRARRRARLEPFFKHREDREDYDSSGRHDDA